MIEVERVDFVSIPTQNLDRAKEFYGVTLGLAENSPDEFDARAALEGAGVQFKGETQDTGVCHMAFFTDPDGNWLILHRRYAA